MDIDVISFYREKWHDVFNLGLVGIAGIFLALTGHRAFFYKMENPVPVRREAVTEAPAPLPVSLPGTMQARDFTEYTRFFTGRNIFSAAVEEQPPVQAPSAAVKTAAADLTRHLKVVGIVLADRAQAIIEDARTGESHFLYEGEAFNGAVLRHITEGKVILLYQGEEVELTQ